MNDFTSTEDRSATVPNVPTDVEDPSTPESKRARWAGWFLSGAAVLFLLFNALPRVLNVPWAVDVIAELGYPPSVVRWLGLALLVCTMLYVIPWTSLTGDHSARSSSVSPTTTPNP